MTNSKQSLSVEECPTCGAKHPDDNKYCSDGFHAPSETYWPIPLRSRSPLEDNSSND